jgi:hypothetical protein
VWQYNIEEITCCCVLDSSAKGNYTCRVLSNTEDSFCQKFGEFLDQLNFFFNSLSGGGVESNWVH